MKNTLIFLISLLLISSCQNTAKKSNDSDVTQSSAISIKEVSRVALVEASQIMNQAKEKGIDLSPVMNTYNGSKKAYDNGQYKQAQILAVKVRHMLEDLLHKK